MVTKIGLISDTHGLLRPEATAALRETNLIIHAGDVGRPEIIEQLNKIAPVTAVRGNIDTGSWASQLPQTAVVKVNGGSIYVLHDVHDLTLDPADLSCRMVVSGHSHKPGQSERDGVLYVNPGSAGPRRFQLPVTVALLDTSDANWKVIFIDLLQSSL